MLSPHELATLFLIKDSPERVASDRPELSALSTLDLIDMEPVDVVTRRPRITCRGQAVLRAFARVA